jgi:hypothetical protein
VIIFELCIVFLIAIVILAGKVFAVDGCDIGSSFCSCDSDCFNGEVCVSDLSPISHIKICGASPFIYSAKEHDESGVCVSLFTNIPNIGKSNVSDSTNDIHCPVKDVTSESTSLAENDSDRFKFPVHCNISQEDRVVLKMITDWNLIFIFSGIILFLLVIVFFLSKKIYILSKKCKVMKEGFLVLKDKYDKLVSVTPMNYRGRKIR